MNEQTGKMFKAQQEEMDKILRQLTQQGEQVTPLDDVAAQRMEPMTPEQRVPFWKNVKANAAKKGTRRRRS